MPDRYSKFLGHLRDFVFQNVRFNIHNFDEPFNTQHQVTENTNNKKSKHNKQNKIKQSPTHILSYCLLLGKEGHNYTQTLMGIILGVLKKLY